MDSINPSEALKFMEYVLTLKHASRRGWDFSNVKDHEQVASHMYSMGMMTFILGNDSTLDRLKCLQLSLVHDLAEAIVGDITPHDEIPVELKHRMEDEAMLEITSHLNKEMGDLIYNLYKEYEAKETPEAKFVKDLDRFDLVLTATHYEIRDNTPGKHSEYFDACNGKFQHPLVKKMMDCLNEKRMKFIQESAVGNIMEANGHAELFPDFQQP